MLFHASNIPAIKACWKRAERFAEEGTITGQHLVWKSNVEAAFGDEYDPSLLSWVAERIDHWCQDNLIEGDTSMAALLHWWKTQMVFDPTHIPDGLAFKKPKKDKFAVVSDYYASLGLDISGATDSEKEWWVRHHYEFVTAENEKNAPQSPRLQERE